MESAIPIDAAEITSIRLVEFPGELPLPPEGHVQVGFSTSYGLVVRFPSGLYAGVAGFAPAGPPGPQGPQGPAGPSGGAGGVPPSGELQFNGHSIVFHDVAGEHQLALYPEPGSPIRLAGPVLDALGQPWGSDGVQVARGAVSSAELLDLHNTPKVVQVAPGAGRFLQLIGVATYLHAGSTPYATASGTGLVVGYPALVPGAYAANPMGMTGITSAVDRLGLGRGYDMEAAAADVLNAPLVLAIDDALTVGNGTLDYAVAYLVG